MHRRPLHIRNAERGRCIPRHYLHISPSIHDCGEASRGPVATQDGHHILRRAYPHQHFFNKSININSEICVTKYIVNMHIM